MWGGVDFIGAVFCLRSISEPGFWGAGNRGTASICAWAFVRMRREPQALCEGKHSPCIFIICEVKPEVNNYLLSELNGKTIVLNAGRWFSHITGIAVLINHFRGEVDFAVVAGEGGVVVKASPRRSVSGRR